jgi:hypothetical protein
MNTGLVRLIILIIYCSFGTEFDYSKTDRKPMLYQSKQYKNRFMFIWNGVTELVIHSELAAELEETAVQRYSIYTERYKVKIWPSFKS